MPILQILSSAEGVKTATAISIQSGFFFCGALTLLSFFTFLVFIKSKEWIYLYYFLFLLFSLLEAVISLRQAFAVSSLLSIPMYSAGRVKELVTLFAYAFYCFFTLKILHIKSQNKKLYYWISLMAISGLLYGTLYVIFRPSSLHLREQAFIYSRLIILFMSIIAIVWIFIKKIESKIFGYFLLGSFFYFLGAFFAVLRDTVSDLPLQGFYHINSETYFQWGILLEVACFTIALSVQIYASYEKKQQEHLKKNALAVYEKEAAQSEALALRIQVNPHFLFNYLNVLKYYIQIEENNKATTYLVQFSKFIRNILDLNQEKTISLEQELDLIKNYLTLEEVRFKQEFIYHININDDINIRQIKIPPMILQPFMEEILWNGREGQLQRKINLSIQGSENITTIVIEETGLSHSTKNKIQEQFNKAVNQQITAERIKLYNKNYKNKQQICFQTPDKKELKKRNKRSQVIIKIIPIQ